LEAACCTTAAMVDAISESLSIVPLIWPIASTDSCVAAWIPVNCWPISPLAFAVCSEVSAPTFTRGRHDLRTAINQNLAWRQLNVAGMIRISLGTQHRVCRAIYDWLQYQLTECNRHMIVTY
jgi:hypothetical protein